LNALGGHVVSAIGRLFALRRLCNWVGFNPIAEKLKALQV
jgi:hypothetical protein